MEIIHTHHAHIEHLIEILLTPQKLYILGARLEVEPYNYKEAIEYLYKMFGYLDAHRIIACGVNRLTHHIELLKLLLKETTAYLGDEELFQATYQLIQAMEDFLTEYSYDVSRHRISHIGWLGNKGYDYEHNAYEIRHTNSFHVYQQFLAYIMNAIHMYLVIKQHCSDLLMLVLQGESQHLHEKLSQEIQAFTMLYQEMEIAAHLVKTVCQQAPDDATRHTTLQHIYRTLYERKNNPILYGIVHNYESERVSRAGVMETVFHKPEE